MHCIITLDYIASSIEVYAPHFVYMQKQTKSKRKREVFNGWECEKQTQYTLYKKLLLAQKSFILLLIRQKGSIFLSQKCTKSNQLIHNENIVSVHSSRICSRIYLNKVNMKIVFCLTYCELSCADPYFWVWAIQSHR